MGLTNVWLECDFSLVCAAFTARTNVPFTCFNYCGKIRFRVTHIFREGNACADKLANLGFIHKESFHWYNRLPSSLFLKLFMNKYNLHMYRFCSYMGFGIIPIFLYFLSFFLFFNNIFSCDGRWLLSLEVSA